MGLGFWRGAEGEVNVYHKTFSFLSSAVYHTHSFSGCKLCFKPFRSPVLSPLLATELICPAVTCCHAVSHRSCVAQAVPFLFFLVGAGAGAATFLTVSGPCLSICELPGAACVCVAAQLFPWPGEDLLPHLQGISMLCPKWAQKNPTQAVFLQQFFSPMVLFIPRSFGLFPLCSSWYCLLLHCLTTALPGSQLAFQLVFALPTVSGRCIRQEDRDS